MVAPAARPGPDPEGEGGGEGRGKAVARGVGGVTWEAGDAPFSLLRCAGVGAGAEAEAGTYSGDLGEEGGGFGCAPSPCEGLSCRVFAFE